MGWDEALFGYFLKNLSRKRSSPSTEAQVTFDEVAPTLRLVAAALAGESIKISEAEGAGGYDGSQIFLPSAINLFGNRDGNRKAYLYRLLAAHATRELGLALPAGGVGDAESRTASLDAIPLLRSRVEKEFPRAEEILRELESARTPNADPDFLFTLFGRLMPWPKSAEAGARAAESCSPESLSSGTEKKGKPRERAEEVKLGESKEDENPLVHVFEKVLTADEYGGGKKNLDGSDELEDHAEALEELNLRHVIRSRERTRSVYKSDVMVDGGAPDLEDEAPPAAVSFSNDEWNHSKKAYRRDWCTVSKTTAREDAGAASSLSRPRPATVKKLRSELERLMNERRWHRRQLDGPEPDLDAVVERAVDLKTGTTPSERIYLSRRRTQREFAATILIDMSLSTDSWVDNRHVIEVARESVLLLGEVLDGIAENVSVAAFSSNTRRDCRFLELKSFDEKWTKLRARLPAMTPTGYTRIGPAIRHANAELKRSGAKRKLLLLISDGKPTDYDRYEGTYGIEDVRQAIREGHRDGIRARSLAIDRQAKSYLPRMFGTGGYQILPHPGLLAPALSKIFAQCLA